MTGFERLYNAELLLYLKKNAFVPRRRFALGSGKVQQQFFA